jgi:N-methylhydantoinase A/oxoprolinase/acetone carboxylase beta subunit
LRVAIETGGTFTDCVYLAEGRLHVVKLFTTVPGKPLEGRNW